MQCGARVVVVRLVIVSLVLFLHCWLFAVCVLDGPWFLRLWLSMVSAILGNGQVSCSAQQNLGTAAKMGGAGRREGKRNVPADALPEAPALSN